MILTGPMIREAGIITPHVKRTVHLGMSYGEGIAGYDIRLADEVKMWPGEKFCLASSMEHFTMPNDVLGEVKDKSTWARRGVSVFNTVIEPGWRGYLTLEIASWAGLSIIPKGSPIAQVLFYRVAGTTRGYNGKYQDQPNRPVPARKEA